MVIDIQPRLARRLATVGHKDLLEERLPAAAVVPLAVPVASLAAPVASFVAPSQWLFGGLDLKG